MLTAEQLKALIHYDPTTGLITRLKGAKKNGPCGHLTHNGYLAMSINGSYYRAHRLAWLYVYGEWPIDQLDHINAVRTDNRIANLRQCTHMENAQNTRLYSNNKSGFKGVYLDKENNKWEASIRVNKKLKHLGRFQDIADAAKAYADAAEKEFGEFKCLHR